MALAARGRIKPGGHHKPWVDALRIAVNREVGFGKDKQRILSLIAAKTARMALEGDLGAIQEIANRLDGRVVQTFSNDPENPISSVTINFGILPDDERSSLRHLATKLVQQIEHDPSTDTEGTGQG